MTISAKLGIIAALIAAYTLLVWRVHDYYDGYLQTDALHSEIADHTKIEQKNNAASAQYETGRDARNQTIQSLQAQLEAAHAKDTAPCTVPLNIMSSIRAANSHRLSR